ncbi:PTS sugar transporter subunit IIA [Alkaliphilus sp. B6464]|uniref:PTS sugar transporter subunit IIA n=1 Tax=Alkaliphilus sp. B6464 TaxID=2731219 RepID=UPI001BABA6E3|nr:PTS glucose transporter subunit IIA [Alkaliphilus sp. B6464]QUH20123.1 PTS glucose transporter subunit IIA [Alkaliphilus sp. B6464]
MFGLFKNKKNVLVVGAPLTGRLINIEEVPDEVFAGKMVGDGMAIEPVEGKVVSPVDGEVIQVFPTKHAIGIKSTNGVEILIHIGLETVSLDGKGFETHINVGDEVKKGQLILTFDLEYIKSNAKSTISPIVITNMDDLEKLEKMKLGEVSQSDAIMNITKK